LSFVVGVAPIPRGRAFGSRVADAVATGEADGAADADALATAAVELADAVEVEAEVTAEPPRDLEIANAPIPTTSTPAAIAKGTHERDAGAEEAASAPATAATGAGAPDARRPAAGIAVGVGRFRASPRIDDAGAVLSPAIRVSANRTALSRSTSVGLSSCGWPPPTIGTSDVA
jgi:hypothetical protein